jgi:hypothetical protein
MLHVAQELATTCHPHMLQMPFPKSSRLQLPSCGAVGTTTPTPNRENRKTAQPTIPQDRCTSQKSRKPLINSEHHFCAEGINIE